MNYDLLPESLRNGMSLYLERGVAPGSFLMACLCDKWTDACIHADAQNQFLMKDIAIWLLTWAPSTAWGSPEKVAAWIRDMRKGRTNATG